LSNLQSDKGAEFVLYCKAFVFCCQFLSTTFLVHCRTGAASYVVNVTLSPSELIGSFSVMAEESPSYIIKDLKPGTTYVMTVTSVGAEGQLSVASRSVRDATRECWVF